MNALNTIGDSARWGVRRALQLYYAHIEVEGRDRLPTSGGVLFVANHPNSLLDPAMIGFAVRRPVHFFAKAPLFDVPVFGTLMKALGMVPAYRGQDDKAAVRKNLETLEVGGQYLARGESVGIFPEGKTHDREGLEQVRTGTARIALSAVQSGAAFTIVPLGLNYQRKERFRSVVWIRVGEPIAAAAWFQAQGDEEKKAMRLLTEEINARLKRVVVHLSEDRWQPILDELDTLLPATATDATDAVAPLRQRKRLADAINHFLTVDRPRAEAMTVAIEAHRAALAGAGLRIDSAIMQLRGGALAWKLTKETLWLLPGLVPAIAGALHHFVPFSITRLIVNLVKHPGRGTIAQNRLMFGLPVYGIWHALVAWWLAHHVALWFTVVWTVAMPFCGIEALHYSWRVRSAGWAWWNELKTLTRRPELQRLRAAQDALREQLRAFAGEYRRHAADAAKL